MPPIHLNNCPVCHSSAIAKIFSAKDYTVSGELYAIWQCNSCTARFTQDIPGPEAIGRYYNSPDYISHSDTKKGIINRLYHYARSITLRQKKRWVSREANRDTGDILDIGCGTGAFLHFLKANGWRVTGLEPDEGARKKAMQEYGLDILPISALYDLPTHQYHVITLWHVLEHIHRLHEDLEQIKTLLAPDGAIFIAVPNYTSLDAQIYREYWAAYDVPRHLYHFSPAAMQALAERQGLKISQTYPMVLDAFYVSLLSEKYRYGRTRYFSAVVNGLRSWLHAAKSSSRCSSVVYVLRKEVEK